jgi:hypothetical protein
MSSVVVGVETDQIAMQYSEKYLIAHWQYSVYFAAGKWCVQEKAKFDIFLLIANLFSEHCWKEH